MPTIDGGQAFPRAEGPNSAQRDGMSLRDYFAGDYSGPAVLIPIESVAYLRRRLQAGTTIEIGKPGTVAAFIAATTGDDRIEIALEGHQGIPALRSHIPIDDPLAKATVPRDWIRAEVDRLAHFCRDGGKQGPIAIFSAGESLRISSRDDESGTEMTGEVSGSASLALKLSDVADALSVSNDETVCIEFYAQKICIRDAKRRSAVVVMAMQQ